MQAQQLTREPSALSVTAEDSDMDAGFSDMDAGGPALIRDMSVDQLDEGAREAMVSPSSTELPLDAEPMDLPRASQLMATQSAEAREEQLSFVTRPVPLGTRQLCRIVRRREGVGSTHHTYEVFLEENNNVVPLLFARKMRSQTASYIVTLPGPRDRGLKERTIARVRSNFLGTGFTIYDNGLPPSKAPRSVPAPQPPRRELAAVMYQPNFLGHKGPRKMTIIIPPVKNDGVPVEVRPLEEKDTLIERHRTSNDHDLIVMHNKAPNWSEETQSFVLDFNQRVTIASVKNFQIVHDHDLDHICIQFGRIAEDTFTMDVQYPFSPTVAFCVALTSFDAKLACE
ncbi:hypothetical protein HK105_207242 [Polyrhizophydium stewartii]|uniref:Tubby C-terminal domain-containing protein n=1 Tax=Polyrhizophydium stewartii TaxID=2732419 RepID=A0ABR4N178_9FUNG